MLKNILLRILLCAVFVAIVIYIHSYHGELINNAQVEWQYLQNHSGKKYLALDVFAPSGIKIDDIYWGKKKVTDSWMLINYPDWYKGEKNCAGLSEFQDVLNPYLPYNNDFSRLYTTGWYTFLYEWNAKDGSPMPDEKNLRVKYRNISTDNVYYGRFMPGVKVFSTINKLTDRGPVFEAKLLYPVKKAEHATDKKNFKIIYNNLVADGDGSKYLLEKVNDDPNVQQVVSLIQMLLTNDNRIFAPGLTAICKEFISLREVTINEYTIYVKDKNGITVDSLNGHVKWDKDKAFQVFNRTKYKTKDGESVQLDFRELFRNCLYVIYVFYLIIICRCVGLLFIRLFGIRLSGYAASTVVPVFLGIIFLTYIVFIIGLFKILYFYVLAILFLLILLFGPEPEKEIEKLRIVLRESINILRQSPWKIVFLVLLVVMLFYNLCYCFVPATAVDGSGDIVNSYLPNLNDYVLSHSFKTPVGNSTNGINSQAIEVLRAASMVLAGERGVYLVSFIYLVLVIGSVYLIGKEIFNIENMLVYIASLLFLCGFLFTESLHFGKIYTCVLAFVMITLYSLRYSDQDRNCILPVLFFGFLTSQFVFLVITFIVYFVLTFWNSYEHASVKAQIVKRYVVYFVIFCIVSVIFNLKLVLEVGTFFVPGLTSVWLSDIFKALNSQNDLYRYLDNNYIRHFYFFNKLAMNENSATLLKSFILMLKSVFSIDFAYLFVFAFIFLKDVNKYKKLYVYIVLSIIFCIGFLFPCGNDRVKLYYIYPLVIIQMAVINDFIEGFLLNRFFKAPYPDILIRFYHWKLYLSTVPSIKECLEKFSKAIRLDIVIKLKNCQVNIGKFYNHNTWITILIILVLPYFMFHGYPKGFVRSLPEVWKIRNFEWVDRMTIQLGHRVDVSNQPVKWFFRQVLPVFAGAKSPYEYLEVSNDARNFDHGMLIRQYCETEDTILVVPVRYHSYAKRHITARHALGSVIYQRDLKSIMADLKKLNIKYLSFIPIHYSDYNPFYTPIFEEGIFYKYFKLLFSDNGSRFYKIIHDGSNTEYSPSPYNVEGLPFVPMTEVGEI